MPNSGNPVLEVRDISAGYGPVQVLHDVSLHVEPGQIVAVIGPNGAGKSTVLKTALGLLEPMDGKIFFNGDDITGLPTHLRIQRGLGYVPQGRIVFPDMTVMENLEMGAYIVQDEKRIQDALEYTFTMFPRLAERRNQRAKTMSGGEQQMLSMARALMTEPQMVILDEPSLGLAPLLVDLVFDTLEALRDAGNTLLVVEQNAARALEVADYAYVLELGRNRFEGPGLDLLDNEEVHRLYLGG